MEYGYGRVLSAAICRGLGPLLIHYFPIPSQVKSEYKYPCFRLPLLYRVSKKSCQFYTLSVIWNLDTTSWTYGKQDIIDLCLSVDLPHAGYGLREVRFHLAPGLGDARVTRRREPAMTWNSPEVRSLFFGGNWRAFSQDKQHSNN